MKTQNIICMLILLMAIVLLSYSVAYCEQHENGGKPKIALILSKPVDDDTAKSGTDKDAPAEVESAEIPVQYNAADDNPAKKGMDNGKLVEIEDDEKPVQEDASDYFNRGVAHDKLGMYREAIESYRQAVMIKPDYAEAYYNLAFSCLLSNDVTSAHDEYMQLKDINPQMADDLYNKALIMVRTNPENKFVVQVGAYRNVQNANAIIDKLKANYMHARIEAIDGFNKVRVFGMKNKEEADLMMKDIRDKFKIDSFVVPAHK